MIKNRIYSFLLVMAICVFALLPMHTVAAEEAAGEETAEEITSTEGDGNELPEIPVYLLSLKVEGFDSEMKQGESCSLTLTVTYYDQDNIYPARTLDREEYTLSWNMSYGYDISENEDGRLTVTRTSKNACWILLVVNGPEDTSDTWSGRGSTTSRLVYVKRIAGDDRYQTATEAASAIRTLSAFASYDAYVIACGDNFPDALAGCPLAVQKNAPILLAGKNASKNQTTYDYLDKYAKGSETIYLLGGTAAVPQEVEDTLVEKGFQVVRLAGGRRYDTNVEIVKEMKVAQGTDVVVVSGSNYADSLSISGIAGMKGMPIILAPANGLQDNQITLLKEIDPANIHVIGGTAAVSDTVEQQIKAEFSSAKIDRIYGADRYKTSVAIAEYFHMETSKSAVLAYGRNFPDGLTGGVLAAKFNAPVLLVEENRTQDQILFLKNSSVEILYVMGGESAISETTVDTIKDGMKQK